MSLRGLSFVVIGLGLSAPALAQTQASQAQPAAAMRCVEEMDARLKAWRVTPERYEQIVAGACLIQRIEYLDALRDQLSSIGGSQASTEARVSQVEKTLEAHTRIAISSYALWYEGSSRANGG